jgi:hypothetical protein
MFLPGYTPQSLPYCSKSSMHLKTISLTTMVKLQPLHPGFPHPSSVLLSFVMYLSPLVNIDLVTKQ